MAKTLKKRSPLPPSRPRRSAAREDIGAISAEEEADLRELRRIQQVFAGALFRPLVDGDKMQEEWIDGRPMIEVTDEFIQANDRLTSVERLEIYSKSYWYRLIDCLYDDFPAVRAAVGDKKFFGLITAYLAEYPSESYTARDLGRCLEQFLRDHPEWGGRHFDLALDCARFEWAQVLAFDNEAKKPLALDSALGADPSELRLGLQPYLCLLDLNYPIDDYIIALRQREDRLQGGASNTSLELAKHEKIPRVAKPKRAKTWVAVHRLENSLYYKRIDQVSFEILKAIQEGKTLAEACDRGAAVAEPGMDLASEIQAWFHLWASLGWLCAR
jgi:hypothetical protein